MMRALLRIMWVARVIDEGRQLSAEEQAVVNFWFSGVVYGAAVGAIFTLALLK